MLRNVKQNQFNLLHSGDCSLLAVTADFTIYAEEWYDGGWIAQHALTRDGEIIASADEKSGKNPDFAPLTLPVDSTLPAPITVSQALNFTGARLQGIRQTERIHELVLPLSLAEKFALIQNFYWQIPPMSLLGVAESTVLAEAQYAPDRYAVCRRLRIAYALSDVRRDATGQTYDYDTWTIYLLHDYEATDTPPPLDQCLDNVSTLRHPMDCIYFDGHLIVAEGGGDIGKNRVHLFQY